MKGSIKLFTIFDITVSIHITFFLLLLIFMTAGLKALFLIIAIFFFVTLHELAHSLVAKRFGVIVREITLMPIGGIARMSSMPEKPRHEFLISIAGPLFNILVIVIFYYPLRFILSREVLGNPLSLSTETWPRTIAYVYWINLILALFNLIPAFPMDGGRVLRSVLARQFGYPKATKIAVNFGHTFALIFGYLGIVQRNLVLIAIAVFIYMAASNEELHIDVREVLKRFRVRDVLSSDFYTIDADATLANALELVFHTHHDNFPVMERGTMVGFLSRQGLIASLHQYATTELVRNIMQRDVPTVEVQTPLLTVQRIMQERDIKALPVMKQHEVVGVVTLEDVGRVYTMMSSR